MEFADQLIFWYRKNKRDLPWRNTKDPYRIWLSEIILQQTRVVQGYSYYTNFIDTFPDVIRLASARETDVLKLWQGLGYYSRARNLHYTAKQIVEKYAGVFPQDYDEILQLKGIGVYTAAAIASFAFNKPYSVIDGNVYRVLSRLFGISTPIDKALGKKEFATLAQALIPENNPGEYNQAIMEFGALQCTPQSPDCSKCCFFVECEARKSAKIKELPIKEKKISKRVRFFNYLIIHHKDTLLIQQRGPGDIWQGLYEFPLFESNAEASEVEVKNSPLWKSLFKKMSIPNFTKKKTEKHLLTHQTLHTTYWEITVDDPAWNGFEKHFLKTPYQSITAHPFPRPIATYLEYLNL